MKRKTIISVTLALILLTGVLGGCSGSNAAGYSTAPQSSTSAARLEGKGEFYGEAANVAPSATPVTEEYAYDMAEMESAVNVATGGGISASAGTGAIRQSDANRKIVYTADVSLQTKDFDNGVAAIERMTGEIGGFIQSSSVQGQNLYNQGYRYSRWAYFTVRVPDDKLQEFLNGLSAEFNVGSTSLYSNDITLDYFDVKARLESLEVQQERLMEMLGQSTEVEYLIEVQKELARVNYEIESYTSSLNRMDDSVNYSTVNLNIEEVVAYDDPQPVTASFGEQISGTFAAAWRGFVNFCRNAVLAVVSMTPFFAFAIPAAVVVILLLRRRKKRRAAKTAPPAPDNTPINQNP